MSHISAAMALWLTRMASIPLSANVPQGDQSDHALNDLIARAFASAGIPAINEPQGLSRSDGKRPDNLTLIPWQVDKALSCDVTVVCPLAESCVDVAAQDAARWRSWQHLAGQLSTPIWRDAVYSSQLRWNDSVR